MPLKTMLKQIIKIEQRPRKLISHSHIVPEQEEEDTANENEDHQSPWACIPPDLLHAIIRRVERFETSWHARRYWLLCAAVCRSWRRIVREVAQTPERSGLLTFPISLKQPGPRERPIHCLIRRDRSSSTFVLYLCLSSSLFGEDAKPLLAAKKTRRPTCLDFAISLVKDDFSRDSSNYVGKLRSNFIGTKFIVYDNQPQSNVSKQQNKQAHRILASISYELSVLRTRGPRRMHCQMHSIPLASIQEGGTAPTPTSFAKLADLTVNSSKGSLNLKNKAPRWHKQLGCWCLNFRGRVTVASVKNFQLLADVDLWDNVPVEEQHKVILQFGKIGRDVFTMDYMYPLSALQAFAICLSSFDTKPACE